MTTTRTMKNLLPFLFVGFALMGITLSGCEEEIGCTDRNSDNYNPDAVRDNGSCINARDKFLGVYRTQHICQLDTAPDPDSAAFQLVTITEDLLREQEDDVEILLFGPDSLKVKALVSRNILTIPTQPLNVRGIPMLFYGEGHIDDGGYLTILYTALPAYEDCVMFMYRVDN